MNNDLKFCIIFSKLRYDFDIFIFFISKILNNLKDIDNEFLEIFNRNSRDLLL